MIAVSCGALIAGCSQSHSQGRLSRSGGVSTRSTGAIDGPAKGTISSDEVFGYAAPNDPRFDVSLDDIRRHVQNNSATIIDARGSGDYEMGHVRGAMNVPPSRKESFLPQITRSVPKDRTVIIYCNGPHCDSAEMVSDYLASQGYTNTRVFKPGWKGLSAAKDIRSR